MTVTTTAVDPRYPTGKFRYDPAQATPEGRRAWVARIAALPARLRAAVEGLSEEQLDTPYREGGWTVRQLVHHVPDSHMNAYVRMKLALTEEAPAIKTYEEARWAELPDSRLTPPEVSLVLVDALHRRWVTLLEALSEEQWKRTMTHPDWGAMGLEQAAALYAWHSDHHVAHITALRERMGW